MANTAYTTKNFLTQVIYHTTTEPKDVDLLWDNNGVLKYYDKEWKPFENLLQRATDKQDGLMTSLQVSTLNSAIQWKSIPTNDLPGRKAIVLNNHDTILAYGEKAGDGSYSILMLNKWGVVDLGTPNKPINLNTPAGVRPTVQEAGQTGEQAHKIAYSEDVTDAVTKLTKSISDEAARATKAEQDITKSVTTLSGTAIAWTSTATDAEPNKKSLTLANGDTISAVGEKENDIAYPILTLTKAGVVEAGNPNKPLQLNVPKDSRVTVLEAGDSADEANEVAYVQDVDDMHDALQTMIATAKTDLTNAINNEVIRAKKVESDLKTAVDSKSYVLWIIFKESADQIPAKGEHDAANYYVRGEQKFHHWDDETAKYTEYPLNGEVIYLEESTKLPYYNIDNALRSPLGELADRVKALENK